ncbi:MAG: DUF885 domain-containing protein [Ilumatobacteraceae bacterium]|nr:DUF885 domain-containing protein [Ilumatobacteraceae bacterium]
MLEGGSTRTDAASAAPARGPGGIFDLSDQYIVQSAALDPVLASFWGLPGHDDEMTDYSPDGWAARLALQRETIRGLGQLQPHDRGDRIAIEVMRERVQAELDLIESGEYHRTLSVLNSHHAYVRDIFDYMPRQSDEDWRNVRVRLASVPIALEKLRESFLYAAANDQVAARRQAIACGEQCRVWGDPDGYFAELTTECQSLDLSVEAAGAAGAFVEFGRWLSNDYAAMATAHDPVGPERYRLFARFHNGTDLDLDETYQWGWDELRSIEARMATLVERILPGGSRDECIAQVKNDPRYSVEGADNFLAWSQDVIDRTIDELDGKYFEIAEPLRNCRAMAAPAGGAETTYYTPPSEDFSRPGQVWHQVAGKQHFPLWEALSTQYHESAPGHHLQLAQMMRQAESLTRFQRLGVAISGHGEGWALYAERLMHELGYLDDPVYELGWLAGQALRAARVVVDIGLHCEMRIPATEQFHPGEVWRSEMGLPFLLQRTGYPTEFLTSEVDRYLGMPGQAISYKVGERVWLEGRDRTRRRLGSDFDLKRFHQVVLDMGAMGLDQLSAELDAITLL